jgi:ABC-type sugar transport system ATPase subunit
MPQTTRRKPTTMRLIVGLDRPDEGTATIGGLAA